MELPIWNTQHTQYVSRTASDVLVEAVFPPRPINISRENVWYSYETLLLTFIYVVVEVFLVFGKKKEKEK